MAVGGIRDDKTEMYRTVPGGGLTSSPGVTGHFFFRRPQFMRFPVCRMRVRAVLSRLRAVSVPMSPL